MSRRAPDWDVDRERGEAAELAWRQLRSFIVTSTAEVKRDDEAHNTGNVYVEYECRHIDGKWHPSGLATTKALTYVFYLPPVLIAMPTWVLRQLSRHAYKDKRNRRECVAGSHPTRGVVLEVQSLTRSALDFWQSAPGSLNGDA